MIREGGIECCDHGVRSVIVIRVWVMLKLFLGSLYEVDSGAF